MLWDLKPGALREFSPKVKSERREGGPEGNCRQAIYRKEIPPSQHLESTFRVN